MTRTPAMTQARRLASYAGDNTDQALTPAQVRRYRHKARHAYARRHGDGQQQRVPAAEPVSEMSAAQITDVAAMPRKRISVTWPGKKP